jgi:hypothetical protein
VKTSPDVLSRAHSGGGCFVDSDLFPGLRKSTSTASITVYVRAMESNDIAPAQKCAKALEQEVMKPTYFSLTFSTGLGAAREETKVYIELQDRDRDLVYDDSPPENSRAMARPVGLLDLLPSGINPDWPHTGKLVDADTKGSWDRGIEPTIIKGHNVWIFGDA